MRPTRVHTIVVRYPFAGSLPGGRLLDYTEVGRDGQRDIRIDYLAFEPARPGELFENDGKIMERVAGTYSPARVRFTGVTGLQGNEWFLRADRLPTGHADRTLRGLMAWRQPGARDPFHVFFVQAPESDGLLFFAREAVHERLPGAPTPVGFERDWSPAPPMPGGAVPLAGRVRARFGGDPVTVWIDSRPFHRRLFVGGRDIQGPARPQVDAVLNLGEEASAWAGRTSEDRWEPMGEGSAGMSLEQIRRHAEWVIAHLRAGRRVLVHCMAGLNRSSTVCCAALILLEGLSAEAALARVREQHRWAGPDSAHWIKLRWLAQAAASRSGAGSGVYNG
jgi:hypothetical protein